MSEKIDSILNDHMTCLHIITFAFNIGYFIWPIHTYLPVTVLAHYNVVRLFLDEFGLFKYPKNKNIFVAHERSYLTYQVQTLCTAVFAVSNHSVFGHRRDTDSFCTSATNVSEIVTAKLFIKPSGNHSNPSN